MNWVDKLIESCIINTPSTNTNNIFMGILDEQITNIMKDDTIITNSPDSHYDFTFKGIRIDPNFVSRLWGITSLPLNTALKKIARAGNGGYKDKRQDIRDCINALEHELKLMDLFDE